MTAAGSQTRLEPLQESRFAYAANPNRPSPIDEGSRAVERVWLLPSLLVRAPSGSGNLANPDLSGPVSRSVPTKLPFSPPPEMLVRTASPAPNELPQPIHSRN